MRPILCACLVAPILACGAGAEPPAESVAAPTSSGELRTGAPRNGDELRGHAADRPNQRVVARSARWILGIHQESETTGEGTSRAEGAYELELPERGAFTAEAVLRLRTYPRRIAGCTILSSSGFETTTLHLDGQLEDDTLHLRESTEARQVEVTMECDDLILTTPTAVPASAHEFDLRLRDGETYEYVPPGQGPGRRSVVRYVLQSRAALEARIRARGRPELPIELCRPSDDARAAIEAAIRAREPERAIALAEAALGLGRLGRRWTLEYASSSVDPDFYGGCREGLDGRITITLGPPALQTAPVLLGTLVHEAVGHGLLGSYEHDPAFSQRWEIEELEALRIEADSAAELGHSATELARIHATLARRRAALLARDPGLATEVSPARDTAAVQWISCEDD